MTVLVGLQHVDLAHREGHIHRVLTNDERQWTGSRAHEVALGDIGAADFAGDGRTDLGVSEIDVRGFKSPFVGQHLPCRRLVSGQRLVAGDGSSRLPVEQFLGAFQLDFAQRFASFRALQRPLSLCDSVLVETLLDQVERAALFDQVAPREPYFLKEALDPSHDLNAIDRFHPPNEVLRLGDRFELGLHNSNWHRGWRRLLRERWEDGAKRGYQQRYESHSTPLPRAHRREPNPVSSARDAD
jgi:hypothetical protein